MIKSMVVSMLMAALAMFATAVAQPGRDGDPYERAERQTERMKEHLGLSDEQTEQVSEINIAAAEKMQEARESANGDREAMRSKMMTIRQETNTSLKEVLSEEQWTKFEAIRQEMRQNGGRARQDQGQNRSDDAKAGKKKSKSKKEQEKEKTEDSEE